MSGESDPFPEDGPGGRPGWSPVGQPGWQPGWAMRYAGWPRRALALVVDLLLLWPFDLVVGLTFTNLDNPDAAGLIGTGVYFLALCFLVWNRVVRQGRTGRSIGKQLLGVRLLGKESGDPIGAGSALVRELAHILDALPCFLGFLWPVWDAHRQTFADKLADTVVVVERGKGLLL